ncbi:MAG: cytochrome c oxidase subunit [Methylobacteriaceae bacterium]|jgi:cytochrome c oxidase subunit 2|nr:cytochrome c oxidase subunit [Methylobacteriaceae bacterium]
MIRRLACLFIVAGALSGCRDWQSAANQAGAEAERIWSLTLTFTIVLGFIWLAVMIAVAIVIRRRHRAAVSLHAAMLDDVKHRRNSWIVGSLLAATALTVAILTALSFVTQRPLFAGRAATAGVRLIGHQWWWEVRYDGATPSEMFTTANEIHIPVGTPIRLSLESADVIHSFWVPSLAGKQDLIPGHNNSIELLAQRPGVYRGQCAEFCGLQHAHMGLLVVAEEPDAFEKWQAAQRAAAAQPQESDRAKGAQVFVSKPCALCHTIRGTSAGGNFGPDLTHLGSRAYIGADTLPLTAGSLAAWIADPHGAKPGVNMPPVHLQPDELNAVTSYLIGLK